MLRFFISLLWSPVMMSRFIASCLISLWLLSALVACGQKGPLYLPEDAQQDTAETQSER